MDRLKNKLNQIDNKSYGAYKDLQGTYDFKDFKLHIDYVQGDPFASPSRIRVEVAMCKALIPNDYYNEYHKKIATCDFFTRVFFNNIKNFYQRGLGSGKSGLLTIDCPGQEILERTSIYIDNTKIEARLEIGLPAQGRRVLGREAFNIFFNELPSIVKESLFYNSINKSQLENAVNLSIDQQYIRNELNKRNLVSFIANGSILPRESGISQKRLKNNVIPFESPNSLEITLDLPIKGQIKGMAIPEGITIIIGGGYHGKSTLLNAIELGVYNHISGDGREYVITRDDGVKVRAEDGRAIKKVDISMFINNLPNKKDTLNFTTENASGSTSQGAAIVEAIESGSKLLLIDEDTSATNFMVRDEKMQRLVSKEKEPITPFISRVKSLYENNGISTIVVVGSCGEYFNVANTVIMLDEYKTFDATLKAKELVTKGFKIENEKVAINNIRILLKKSFSEGPKGIKIKCPTKDKLIYNKEEIDLKALEQLMNSSQTRAIGEIFKFIRYNICNDNLSLVESVERAYKLIKEKGLQYVSSYKGHPGNLALPRKYEVIAALNRFRSLNIK